MRIISGKFKGKKIIDPKDKNTRPLKDLTKESIFNIIQHSNKFKIRVNNSNILDLFSGAGSFGLECLSRGSSHVTFIENYKEVLPILKRNIFNINHQDQSLIIEKNIFNITNFNNFEKKFDIIFIDPPYREKKVYQLKKNGIFIIHRHKKENDEFPINFNIIEEKIYGISRIIFGN